jgi:hypothetical protein
VWADKVPEHSVGLYTTKLGSDAAAYGLGADTNIVQEVANIIHHSFITEEVVEEVGEELLGESSTDLDIQAFVRRQTKKERKKEEPRSDWFFSSQTLSDDINTGWYDNIVEVGAGQVRMLASVGDVETPYTQPRGLMAGDESQPLHALADHLMHGAGMRGTSARTKSGSSEARASDASDSSGYFSRNSSLSENGSEIPTNALLQTATATSKPTRVV